jgi:hypothetical protein
VDFPKLIRTKRLNRHVHYVGQPTQGQLLTLSGGRSIRREGKILHHPDQAPDRRSGFALERPLNTGGRALTTA